MIARISIIGSGGFPAGLVVKNLPSNTGDLRDAGLIPGSGRSLAGGNGNPPLCSCLENPLNRGVRLAIVDGYKEMDTTEQLSLF